MSFRDQTNEMNDSHLHTESMQSKVKQRRRRRQRRWLQQWRRLGPQRFWPRINCAHYCFNCNPATFCGIVEFKVEELHALFQNWSTFTRSLEFLGQTTLDTHKQIKCSNVNHHQRYTHTSLSTSSTTRTN